ncbi:hypothetical protein ACR1PO_05720 [Chryseobacterium sp. RRHN12]
MENDKSLRGWVPEAGQKKSWQPEILNSLLLAKWKKKISDLQIKKRNW